MEENEVVEGKEEEKETDDLNSSDVEEDVSWEQAGLDTEEDSAEPDEMQGAESPKTEPSLPKFTDLKKDPSKINPNNLDFILDIPLEVTVELGRSRMLINDLLQLGLGSIIELRKLAGEPLEVLINGRLIAKGEVVVLNDKFGIRLTDVISPTERIEQLS